MPLHDSSLFKIWMPTSMTPIPTQPLPTWRPARLSRWQQFRRDPAKFLALRLYPSTRSTHSKGKTSSLPPISVVCISDTHTTQPDVPDGDILLHAGDLTNRGSFEELQAQLDWLKSLPHRHKVVIAGNHDLLLDPGFVANFPDRIYEGNGTSRSDLDWGDVIYLNNSAARLKLPKERSLVVYGSPLTEQSGTWAFQYPPIRSVWTDSVPLDTDVLLTHGPPKGHLDQESKGCPQLLKEIWRVRPNLVVFGHIHDGHGQQDIVYDAIDAAYDGVMAGDRGIVAVLLMAFLILLRSLSETLLVFKWFQSVSPRRCTTLVNAAVVTRKSGQERQQPAIVVEM